MPSPVAPVVFWAAVLCCIVAEVAIVRSTARVHVRGGEPSSPLPPLRRAAEVTWAVLPALVLAGVLAWTWREMHR